MLERLVETLVEPPETEGHALVRYGEELAVSFGLVHGLEEQRDGLVERLVRPNAREAHQRPRPGTPRRQLRDRIPELRFRAGRIPGLVVQVGRVDGATEGVLASVDGSQLARPVEQQCGRTRRAASPRVLRSILESGGDRLVRL